MLCNGDGASLSLRSLPLKPKIFMVIPVSTWRRLNTAGHLRRSYRVWLRARPLRLQLLANSKPVKTPSPWQPHL